MPCPLLLLPMSTHSPKVLLLQGTASFAVLPSSIHGTKEFRLPRPAASGSPVPRFASLGGGLGLKFRLSFRQQPKQRKRTSTVVLAANGVPATERIVSALGYLLPLVDGLQYGRYFFAQYPASEAFFRPLFPLLRFYSSIPYSNFIAFFSLYLAVVRNPNFSRYVRFNAMQACVLDVLIILPLIVQRIFSPRSGVGLDLLIIFYNTIFIFLLVSVVFGVVSCLLGKTPRLPIVADAAENQLF